MPTGPKLPRYRSKRSKVLRRRPDSALLGLDDRRSHPGPATLCPLAPPAVVKLPAGLTKFVPTGDPAPQFGPDPLVLAVLGSNDMPVSNPKICGDRYTALFVV